MNLYLAKHVVRYEGPDLIGVYDTLDKAKQAAEDYELSGREGRAVRWEQSATSHRRWRGTFGDRDSWLGIEMVRLNEGLEG